MIDVIIPTYNAHETIDKTLMSIAMQDYADKLKVYIVNDASKEDYQSQVECFSKFLNIQELKIEKNQGPGYARQYGIDHSYSDYIIFIDSDDVLLNFQAVTQLYKQITSGDYDVVSGVFFEELDENFHKHCNDTIFMHGKIYKRKFLLDNKIHFNNTYSNEDNGFNSLIILHEGKIKFIDDEIYVWRNNKNSITRRNNHEYSFMGIEGYIYNIKWAVPLCKLYLEYPPTEEKKNELFWSLFNQNLDRINNSKLINPILTFDQFIDKVMKYDSSNVL